MKKSLIVISFAFIFLLSVSFVSAGFFDWITGDVAQEAGKTTLPPLSVKTGQTETIGNLEVQLTKVDAELGTVTAEVKDSETGEIQQVTLNKGTNTLSDGTQVKIGDLSDSKFLTRASASISVVSPPTNGVIEGVTGVQGATDAGLAGFAGGEVPSDAGAFYVGDNIVEVTSSGDGIYGLNIDTLFNTNVLAGQAYAVPIPNLCFYWEVSVAVDGTATFEVKETGRCGLSGVETGTGETEKGCIDTDEGLNTKVKGRAYIPGTTPADKWIDNCLPGSSSIAGATSTQIMEYTCVEGVVTENVRDCETTCVDGTCV